MVNRERKKIQAQVGSVDLNYLTLAFALKEIQSLIEKYGEDAEIQTDHAPYSDNEYLALYVYRDETDAEMVKRISNEELWDKQNTANEAREYERLKAKFEK